ncbi:hypothetical protein Anapl_05566 [Anas platyrhynchos]|uniref:Uncharacterized protein n=1 Tax=Anas platyrhynchos TaxID=8839 RepID=R0JZM9_ANAPL|nr:hypothetical protein Anapl_05566 [Anas platyrhynchos]
MKKKKLSDVVVREEYGTAEVQTCPPGASQPQGNSSGSSLQPCAAVPVSALKVRMKTLVPKKLQAKALMGTTEGSSAEEKLFFPGYRILNYYQVGQRVKLNLEMNLTLENGKMVHLIWLCRRSQVEPNTWESNGLRAAWALQKRLVSRTFTYTPNSKIEQQQRTGLKCFPHEQEKALEQCFEDYGQETDQWTTSRKTGLFSNTTNQRISVTGQVNSSTAHAQEEQYSTGPLGWPRAAPDHYAIPYLVAGPQVSLLKQERETQGHPSLNLCGLPRFHKAQQLPSVVINHAAVSAVTLQCPRAQHRHTCTLDAEAQTFVTLAKDNDWLPQDTSLAVVSTTERTTCVDASLIPLQAGRDKKNNISFNELEYIQHQRNCAGLGVAVSSHTTATGKETGYKSVGNLSTFYFFFSHVQKQVRPDRTAPRGIKGWKSESLSKEDRLGERKQAIACVWAGQGWLVHGAVAAAGTAATDTALPGLCQSPHRLQEQRGWRNHPLLILQLVQKIQLQCVMSVEDLDQLLPYKEVTLEPAIKLKHRGKDSIQISKYPSKQEPYVWIHIYTVEYHYTKYKM